MQQIERIRRQQEVRMKIAFLSPFYPYRGGIAQSSALLLRSFEQRHEVLPFNFSRQYPGLLFPGKTQRVPPDDTADRITAEPVLDSINPLTWFRAARRIAAPKPDILLMRFWMPFFGPSLGTVAARLRRKGVLALSILDNVTPHEPRPGDRWLLRYFLNRNDGFVALSQTVAEDLLRYRPDARYVVYPHPVYDHFPPPVDRDAACARLGVPPDKRVLLFFGFIREYKGLDIVLEALARLPDEYVLLIAGEVYGSFQKYAEIIDRNGLAPKIVSHLRYIRDEEVPLFFSAADLAVLPYKSATQSGIAQIACHYRLPAVVTRVGGLTEMVEDGVTGMVIERPDAKLLAAQIETYFRENWKPRFAAALEERRRRYTWAGLAQTIEEFAEQLLAEKR